MGKRLLGLVVGLVLAACSSDNAPTPAAAPAPSSSQPGATNGPDASTLANPGATDEKILDTGLLTDANLPTIKVKIGNGPEYDAVIDTGTTGIWTGMGVARDGGITASDTPVQIVYGGRIALTGVEATGQVTIGGVVADNVTFGVVRTAACQTCNTPADPTNVFGTTRVVIGAGLQAPKGGNFTNPMTAITTHGQWIFSMGHPGVDAGHIVLNPSPGRLARFGTPIQLTADSDAPNHGWGYQAMPICVNSLCEARGLMDSGNSTAVINIRTDADYAPAGLLDHSAKVAPPNSQIHVDFNNGAASYDITVGDPPKAGIDRFSVVTVAEGSYGMNSGTLGFRYVDMFYDQALGQMAVANKL